MFTISVRVAKAFAAEQKIRELETRISKLNAQKLNISPAKIISNSAANMNKVKNEKYRLSPEETEKKSISVGRFRTVFNMHRIEKAKLLHEMLKRFDDKKYSRKKNIKGKFEYWIESFSSC